MGLVGGMGFRAQILVTHDMFNIGTWDVKFFVLQPQHVCLSTSPRARLTHKLGFHACHGTTSLAILTSAPTPLPEREDFHQPTTRT
jgi:hypothetical protein